MQSEQYSNFLALSSSVSGFDGLLEAEALLAPRAGAPVPGCSELPPLAPLLQPGEEEAAGAARGGVGVVMTGQTEGTGESMGGVGGLVRGVRGPEVRRGPFNCGSSCGSSAKKIKIKKNTELNVKYNAE